MRMLIICCIATPHQALQNDRSSARTSTICTGVLFTFLRKIATFLVTILFHVMPLQNDRSLSNPLQNGLLFLSYCFTCFKRSGSSLRGIYLRAFIHFLFPHHAPTKWEVPVETAIIWFGVLLFPVWGPIILVFFESGLVFFWMPASLLFLLLCFSAFLLFLLLCFSAFLLFLLLRFSASLLSAFLLFLFLCFSAFPAFPASLLFCFSCFFAFLLLCFSAVLLFCFSCFFASLLFCFSSFLLCLLLRFSASLLFLLFSFLLLCSSAFCFSSVFAFHACLSLCLSTSIFLCHQAFLLLCFFLLLCRLGGGRSASPQSRMQASLLTCNAVSFQEKVGSQKCKLRTMVTVSIHTIMFTTSSCQPQLMYLRAWV